MNLERITTQFIDYEDRIRLTGQVGDGQTVVLWLTQRLLQRLVPHLFQWLEDRTVSKVKDQPLRAQVQHSFVQQKARSELKPQAAILPDPVSLTWVVRSVDLKSGSHGAQLVFKGGHAGENATLGFSSKALRQWLGILHDQYRIATWSLAVWPEWMDESRPLKPSQLANKVLH